MKKIFSAVLCALLIFAAVPPHASAATTLTAKRAANPLNMDDRYAATIDGNIMVTLDEYLAGKVTSHHLPADVFYELEIQAPEIRSAFNDKRDKRNKYKAVFYEKAVIETRGNVQTQMYAANPSAPQQKSGAGLAYLRVSATTDIDTREQPREARPYSFVVHLTGVAGLGWDDESTFLGDYDIVFEPKPFVFFHDPAKVPLFNGKIHGGSQMVQEPKEGGANAEGPTPVLAGADADVDALCADLFNGLILLPTVGDQETEDRLLTPDELREMADILEMNGQREEAQYLWTLADTLEALNEDCEVPFQENPNPPLLEDILKNN